MSRTGGGSTAGLTYDPLGRLYEVNGGGSSIVRFEYDGDALVAEYGASGGMIRRHIHGTDEGDDPLVTIADATINKFAYQYQMPDERGSIVALTDAYGQMHPGVWGALNAYDEYGTTGISAAAIPMRTGRPAGPIGRAADGHHTARSARG